MLFCCTAKAQDPHFTQYQSSPLLLNPTLTGFFNGDVRISGVYRNQWQNIASPFNTGSFSVDANVLKGVIRDGDILGIGFTGMFDASNNGGLKVNNQLQVVQQNNLPIENLFAAGEILGAAATSGHAFCGGMLLTPAISFGKWLGETL